MLYLILLTQEALCTTRSDGTKLHILVSKLHSGTSKTMHLSLVWKSHCATCSPVCVIFYHVTGSCKGPILQNIWTTVHFRAVFDRSQEGFDTTNHEILLAKLDNYDVRGENNSWLRSYLTGRKQNTEFNNVVSEDETTLCGVPQGSVLGPLLFLLCTNDICKSSSLVAFYLFSDDTSIIIANTT